MNSYLKAFVEIFCLLAKGHSSDRSGFIGNLQVEDAASGRLNEKRSKNDSATDDETNWELGDTRNEPDFFLSKLL